MPSLPRARAGEIVAALKRAGFVVVSTEAHVKPRHADGRMTMVPNHPGKTVKVGTLGRRGKDAGLTVDAFRALL